MARSLSSGSEFVSYIDAIGELDGERRILDWKTTTSRYPEEPVGLLSLDPQLICYSWISRTATGRSLRTTVGCCEHALFIFDSASTIKGSPFEVPLSSRFRRQPSPRLSAHNSTSFRRAQCRPRS